MKKILIILPPTLKFRWAGILLITLLFSTTAYTQVVYVPLYNSVYDFLDRLSVKQVINLDDEVKPFSREYITEKLEELTEKGSALNKIERDELEFYRKEFAYELGEPDNERWFLYSHSDSLFHLTFSPVVGYGFSANGENAGHHRWIGASAFGTYSDWFGAQMDLRDKGEFGDNVDREKDFSPMRGAWYKGAPDGIEYTDVKGAVSFDFGLGNVSIVKEYFQWGHGEFGNVIFSDKSPSYPRIELHLKPVEWLRFSYFHGWLNSQVIDSNNFYISYPNTISERVRENYINKYVAANLLTISPVKWLDVSAGNAIVYGGDDIHPEFFIPFMFFKFLDHNTGRGDIEDGNGMMYFDVSAKYPENFHFYSSLFIDVTEIRNILDNDYGNTWIGFTFGGKTVDLLFDNIDLLIEYTRINPWLYEHKDEVTNYKHLGYSLGHWLGQNGDQLRVQVNYQPLRGLKFELFGERIRKGVEEEVYYAYAGRDEREVSFLDSPLREETRFGLNFSYEYMHDLRLVGGFSLSDVSDQDEERYPEFYLGNNFNYRITLMYGM